MNRSALITVFACLIAFVLGFVLGRFSYANSTMNVVGDSIEQASESMGIPNNSAQESSQATGASQQGEVNVNTSNLTPGQRQLIEALGIDANSITITAEMVACAEAKLGTARVEEIKKGQLIIEYTGDRITEDEANKRGGRYLFEVTDNLVIDGKGRENTARYVNHACKPNSDAEHDEEEDRIFIRAKKNIAKGEEITYHYGKEYMKQIIGPEGCKCATCLAKG